MRRILSIFAMGLLAGISSTAQSVATFDTLTLTGTDTFYVNYSQPKADVGFEDGLAHFPCYYDTAWGGTWEKGFAYSNMTDTVNGSFTNIYSAITGKGYDTSGQYAVVSAFSPVWVNLTAPQKNQHPQGFYVTNTTYGYKEMKNGGWGKKFGGVPNTDPDWFKLTVKGYINGSMVPDSVEFYLADFRDPDSTKDYIVNTWEYVDLKKLGRVDSITFALASTDTAGGFGMNNPAYFCIDHFEINQVWMNVPDVNYAAKVYPNPATNFLYVETPNYDAEQIFVRDVSGKVVDSRTVTGKRTAINVEGYVPGTYFMQVKGKGGIATLKFIKQ